jgi:hypothetical protein
MVESSANLTRCGGKIPRPLKERVALLAVDITAFVMESRFIEQKPLDGQAYLSPRGMTWSGKGGTSKRNQDAKWL